MEGVIIKRKTVIYALLGVFGLLFSGHLAALFSLLYLGKPNALGLVPVFHFDRESNLPTLFSGIQLAIASLIAFGIANYERSRNKSDSRSWTMLGIALAFIGIDDVAHLHENLDTIIMSRVETSGLIHWPWVIPYSILTLAVITVFFRFFLNLNASLRRCIALSGAMFVTGAIGMEMLAARHAENFGDETLTYAVFMTVEESLEMLSITLLIAGLLRHAISNLNGLDTQFSISR